MRNKSAFWWIHIVFLFAMTAWPILAFAQEAKPDSDELAVGVGDAVKANIAAMSKYSWRVKTALVKDGESKATSITEMRFNAEGKIEATNIGGESNVEKKRGVRGRQQEKKLEDFAAYLEGVLTHSFNYIFLSKGTLVDIFDRAKITQTESSVEVSAGDLFVKGDELFMSVNPADKLPQKLTFKTTLEKDTITGTVTYAKIENGPNRPTQLEIQIPTQSIKITSETYDWVAQK